MERSSHCIPIYVDIPKWEDKVAGKIVTFYYLEVHMGNHSWKMEKRYSQLNDLHQSLKKKYAELPLFPSKGLFKLKPEQVDIRRLELEAYCKEIAKRTDMRTDPFFRDFFELDLNNSNSICYSPIKIAEMD